MKSHQIRDIYLNEVKHFRILVKKEERLLLILSVFRLFSFIGGFIIIWFGFANSFLTGLSLILAVATMFLYLLKLFLVHTERRELLLNQIVINESEANAIAGDLSAFEPGNSYIDTGHDFSHDVDLFGNSSLFQYLNRTVTGYGRDILAGWLSDPFSLSAILNSRQEAIKELAVNQKWRHEFMASGMKKLLEKNNVTGLLQWMEEATEIEPSSVKKLLIFSLPVAALIAMLLMLSGLLHYSVFLLFFLVNLLYTAVGLKKTNKIHNALSRKHGFLTSMDKLLKIFDKETFKSSILYTIKLNISGKKVSAAFSVNKLSRILHAFDSRMNVLVGFALNGLLLWDYHCIYRLEQWKSEYKNQFPVWLEMLGQIDAYISLGNYAYNNPDFVYPVISDSNCILFAKNIGHQLLNESKRICNDLTLERAGTVCIISGANMAGKSTFLRTLAVNYILAMAGAPVCAEEMYFKPMKLFTSMRTTDSLSNNESYFYAELKRLRILKSMVEKGEPVLFILDEILKGTNSADKSLGSKLFLKKMIELKGTGLIATHDISLGEIENDYYGIVINKCFEVEIDGEIMRFDYKLQDGITRKMNAAFLMKQMGILE
jgi:hypothetical protein